MKLFYLKIGTPNGMNYQGEARSIRCRTICGDVAILAGHSNFCTALGTGEAAVVLADGRRQRGRCSGGMVAMINGVCHVFARSWEWTETHEEKSRKIEKML